MQQLLAAVDHISDSPVSVSFSRQKKEAFIGGETTKIQAQCNSTTTGQPVLLLLIILL